LHCIPLLVSLYVHCQQPVTFNFLSGLSFHCPTFTYEDSCDYTGILQSNLSISKSLISSAKPLCHLRQHICWQCSDICDQKTTKFFVSSGEESITGHVGVNAVY
jgi:hypothetical protein